MPAKVTQVLFVDDDQTLLDTVQGLMSIYAGDKWQIFTASDVAPALGILQLQQIDLLVLDIHMPVVDGVQFLKLLQRKYPSVFKVVLTGDSTGAYRTACLNNGAELFLEKPRDANGWQAIYATLQELVKLKPEETGFRGVLRKVSLQDVVQLECLAGNSSILELVAGTQRGLIYIKEGKIVHAESGGRNGVEAFFHLYTLAGGEFHLNAYAEPPQIDIVGYSWEGLMMEAAQLRDEAPAPVDEAKNEADGILDLDLGEPIALRTVGAEVADAEDDASLRPQVNEMLVSSLQGDVLYDWKCTNPNSRISVLDFVIQKSALMARDLPLGDFDRLEALGPNARVVAQLQPSHALFVVTSLVPAIQTASIGIA